MKKWMGIAAILIGCAVYAMIKVSISRYEDANLQPVETPPAKQADADDTNTPTPAEDSGSPATAAQIEAVTQAFAEFQQAVESEDYEQAWELTSGSVQAKVSIEKFTERMIGVRDEVAKLSLQPESATDIEGRVRVRGTSPSGEGEWFVFVQEDGQWKLHD